jgi:NitT/TauT family transport system permease protein
MSLVFPLTLIAAWAVAARLGIWPPYLFPGPVAVGDTFVKLVGDGRMLPAIAQSLGRLARGYLIASALGLVLGVLLAEVRIFRQGLKPFVVGLQALPSICWLPLALLWFGLSDTALVFVVVMGSLLAIAISTEDALLGIDPLLHKVSGSYGIRGWRLQLGVLIPAALPGIVTGLKLGWSFAWRALLAGELLYASGGLGQLLTLGRELLAVDQVLAVMLAIVACGVTIDRLVFRTAEQRIRMRWGLTRT